MSRTQDKVCIVTGAALGIGRACAIRLGEQGAKIALFDRLDASPCSTGSMPKAKRLRRS